MLIVADSTKIEHQWTTEEYFRLGERAVFGDRRTELIGGKIYDMAPQGWKHGNLIMWLNSLLVESFVRTHFVRVQLPLEFGTHSVPEPDFALVPKTVMGQHHPRAADLVIEIADSSLGFDLGTKANLYASAAIPEYWVLDVKKLRLEVFRGPEESLQLAFGASYREKFVLEIGANIRPVISPETEFSVGQFFVPLLETNPDL